MKRILIALAITLLIISTNSFAQDRAATLSGIDTNLPSSSKLTAAQLRTSLKAIANSAFDGIDTKMTQAEADERYPQISDGDPTPIYTAAEVDDLITYKSNNQNLLDAIGSPIVVKPFELSWASGGTATTLTSGVLYTLMMEPVQEGIIVTGVEFCESALGVFTGNNFNGVAMYKVVGDGTYERVAISANDETIFKNSNVAVKVPFTAPVTLTKGLYLAAFLYSSSAQTTAPTIFAASVQATNYKIYNNTAVARVFGCIDAQTTMPTTLTAASLTNYPVSIPMMFLYK